MKKAIIILAILITVGAASSRDALAQTWYPANQVTIAWDAVQLPICPPGTASPPVCPNPGGAAVGTIKYQVYSRNDLVSNGTKISGEITATQLLVSFSVWGQYYLGVEAIFYGSGQTVGVPSSTKAWSNVAADTNNNPFGILFSTAPAQPGGLRRVP